MDQIRQRININKELSSLVKFLNYKTYYELTAMNISSVWLLIQKKKESTGRVRLVLTRYYNELINQMAEHGYVLVENEFIYTNHSPTFIRLTKEEKEVYLYGTLMKYNQKSKEQSLISSMIERNRRLAIRDFQETKSFRNVLSGNAKTKHVLPTKQNIELELKADEILEALRENPHLLHDIDKAFFKQHYYEIMDIIYTSKLNIQAKYHLNKYAFNKLKSRFEDIEDMLEN
ncbi:MAG: hypothetical protein IKC49_00115 [Clostridia bacterium]|nr:hypothetical protein [Clostridia bacterium]